MRLTRRDLTILALATIFVIAGYLLFSVFTYRIGFPLDDSWIHQVYARNLALHHEWSFLTGQPSAGSTSPLWTFLLALGFFLPFAPYLWTYLLGGLLLFGLGVLTENIARSVQTDYRPVFPWVGLFFIFEWHMSWAAVSGMETLLYIIVVISVLGLLMVGSHRITLIGLLAGISIWVRPDGLTLLGPLVCYIILMNKSLPDKVQTLLRALLGFLALFALYAFFNLILSDTPMPNTFYAKQAEYFQWQNQPVFSRLPALLVNFFASPSLLLIGYFVKKVGSGIRLRQWGFLFSAIWVIGYCLLYFSRLPIYQHGRYLMPALGVFLLIGIIGLIEFLPSKRTYRGRLMFQTILTGVVLFSMAFAVYGAFLFAQDVAFVESEMVDTARWVAANIPPGDLIATHDIGALGYFGQRSNVVDLAGLISPEVVPFIRDETRLATFMDERGVNYLITFPSWYPKLIESRKKIHPLNDSNKLRTDPMSVYLWSAHLP